MVRWPPLGLRVGAGTLGYIDQGTGRYQPIAEVPGFTRGLDFAGSLAFVGLSQVRESAVFSGIPITERLAEDERTCGVCVVDLASGQVVALLRFDTTVQEIFAVTVLPGRRWPELINDNDMLLENTSVVPDAALADVPPALRRRSARLSTRRSSAAGGRSRASQWVDQVGIPVIWKKVDIMGRIGARDQGRCGWETGAGRGRRRLWPTVMALAGRALLSTLTVSNTNDSGAGSLRAAVNQANSDNGGDAIVFSSLFNTPRMITLTGDALMLTGTATTTITGPGANLLTINGNNISRVFEIAGGSAAVSGLTITGGNATSGAGGGVWNNDGDLTLTDVVISGNNVTEAGFNLTGGGLASSGGSTTLTNCTLSHNSCIANSGGALSNFAGGTTLTNCTVSGNGAFT